MIETVNLQKALEQERKLGIRVQLDRSIRDLGDEELWQLGEVLTSHGLVCIVGQSPMEPRVLHDFAGRWGEVVVLPPGLAFGNQEPGLPSIARVGNVCSDGSIIPGVHYAEYWHHDGNFWQPGENFIVNFLSTVRIPSKGGRTGFFDSRLAYERLNEEQKRELVGATICVRPSEIGDFKDAPPQELPPEARHPVLLPHPRSGSIALYLPNSRTGIESREGEFLTTPQSLMDPLLEELGIYEHAWAEGETLIMDNLQVMHRSLGGYENEPRLLYRCQARLGTAS
ncbi:MAG: taurine dioxygenase [Verrucomicrobiales bacterium]|jgi:taurine dioxygenase